MGRRVLIIDDIESNRKMLEFFFQEMNCMPEVADNGDKALKMLASSRFDLVVTDLNMPKKDGMTIIREIRGSNSDYKNIPIIVVSAFTNKEIKQECFLNGVSDIIMKPVDLIKLETSVKKLLSAK